MVQSSHARQLLILAVVLLTALSFLPLRWLGVAKSLHNLHTLITAPISNPISNVSRWALPAKGPAIDDPAVAAFEEKIEELDAALKRTLIENQRLNAELADMRLFRQLNPGVSFMTVNAPVIGTASDLSSGILRVKSGSRQGVSLSSIATGPGLQLVGKVNGVSATTCTVVPITARNAGNIRARIMLSPDPANPDGLACSLVPAGDGTLVGPVEDRRAQGSADPVRPSVGQLVRLDDPGRWPAMAQMTLVGVVERVEPNPDQPLRSLVVVRPRIDRLDRLAEVTIRLSPEDATAGGDR
jgi:hypothetical protein